MIRVIHLRQDTSIFQLRFETFARHTIINAPSLVIRPSIKPVTPPRILPGLFGVEVTKRVNKTGIDKFPDPFSFFW